MTLRSKLRILKEKGAAVTVTLNLKPEMEQSLLAQAQARGLSLDAYLQEIVARQAEITEPASPNARETSTLPVLHLGAMGALHRRDLYDDAD